MIKIEVEHERFKKDDFIIDIYKNINGYYEAWLKHENYGVSSLMFGMAVNNISYPDFLDTVDALVTDYIPTYAEEYMNE